MHFFKMGLILFGKRQQKSNTLKELFAFFDTNYRKSILKGSCNPDILKQRLNSVYKVDLFSSGMCRGRGENLHVDCTFASYLGVPFSQFGGHFHM